MNKSNHHFHLTTLSPWPLMTALSLSMMLMSTISLFNFNPNYSILLSTFLLLTMSLFQWWRDIIRESTFLGDHTMKIYYMLKMGMILFIISEIMFFISFFWSYFHMSLSPNIEVGMNWPPKYITPFNPFNIPLLNTIILISSGLSITWCHQSILLNFHKNSIISLTITIILGIYFSFLQKMEYWEAPFCLSDSSYGSIFFMATGFHGMHIIIGTIFLLTALARIYSKQMSKIHHFNFESSCWYWHFVDVVWLFLYMSIYWWNF
uniref:Cytochrome c oxidase subunit 3 n=1 Tax=Cleptes metallicorpus TaxID=2491147 RepID=A0A3Q8U9X1_9HYME|nr:cytochrome c oxidase subunit 3 [Cleptes metallicorpus]